jgi:hypothetical protein
MRGGNMQTSRERAQKAIEFYTPDRIPLCLDFDSANPVNRELGTLVNSLFKTDFIQVMNSNPNFVPPGQGIDEWGCTWETFGDTMGEVTGHPLTDWSLFPEWKAKLPDMADPARYSSTVKARSEHPDKFIMGGLGMLMMGLIGLRGYQNYMEDFYLERRLLEELIDIVYEKASDQIALYAGAGADAVIAWEDWGLQDRLMIDPVLWRSMYKRRMTDMVSSIHDRGMKYILHSCGNILDIIDDLIEIGVDVLQLDQQRLMGFDALERYSGSICFFNPVDIQYMTDNGDVRSIEEYCHEMADRLSTAKGGFMYKAYAQPKSVNISSEGLLAECRSFATEKGKTE